MKDNNAYEGLTREQTAGKRSEQDEAEKVKKEVLEHLSKKYNGNFECNAYQSPSMLINYYTFIISEKKENEKPYKFKAFYYPDRAQKFSDGYYGKFLCEHVESDVKEILGSVDYKVYARTTSVVFDESLNSGSSFADVMAIEKTVDVSIYIFGIKKNLEISNVAYNLAEKGFTGKIFYYCIDEEKVKNLSKDNYSDVLSKVLTNKISVEFKTESSIE